MRYQVLQAVCQRVVSCKYHVFREGAPFHGGNTGSNPVGDANKTNNLSDLEISPKIAGHDGVTIELRLERIRRDRRCGWMLSISDCDFLLEVIEQLRERAR